MQLIHFWRLHQECLPTLYSAEAGVVISEVQLSLVCEDNQVDEVTAIIRKTGKIGPNISGWVYVTPVEQALPIGGKEN